MGKIKIHEIAKEAGLTSKEIIEKAKKLGIEVTSHLSSVTDEQANKIKSALNIGNGKTEKDSKEEKSRKGKDEKKNASPVIIRREVIITDEPKKQEEKPKNNRNDVGFVERKKNQDYNIVYRNKTTKPMTFSELFGIKDNKKETKQQDQKETKINNVTAVENEKTNEEIKTTVEKVSVEEVKKSEDNKLNNENINIEKNTEKKEKAVIPENKNMEQAVKKEFGNNNGYRRNDNYNQNRNNNYNERYNQDGNRNNRDNRENNRFQNNRENNRFQNNRNNNYNNGYNNQ